MHTRFILGALLAFNLSFTPLVSAMGKGGAAKPAPGSGATIAPAPTRTNRLLAPPRVRPLARRPVQSPPTPAGQTATMLPDGRWLLVGGEGPHGPQAEVTISDAGAAPRVVAAGKLRRARAWHSATILPNGRVLIVGGVGQSGRPVDTVEVFDPVKQTSEPLDATGLTPRSRHTATLLTDGRVLIIGGKSGWEGAFAGTELWDPRANTTVSLTSGLSVPRADHKATLLADGNVLVEGGADENGAQVPHSELYNAEAQSFSYTGLSSAPADENVPYLAASIPAGGATDVPVDGLIALRPSKPLRVETVNSEVIKLAGPEGAVGAEVVAAEGGRLVFITPGQALLAGMTYTVMLSGAEDEAGRPVSPASLSFTTKPEREPEGVDAEEWVPDASNFGGDWRSRRGESPWQRLPNLAAAPGVTAAAGQVLRLDGKPLPGVTLKVGDKSAVTDHTGRFLLPVIPAGHQVLIIDGRTANRPNATYGVFRVGIDVAAGQTTLLGYTVWMTKLDTAHAVNIASPTTSAMSITNPAIPGLELRLPAQTLIRDMEGKAVTRVSITPIPTDRPPFPLPAGVDVPVYFTVQPGGSQLIPPRAQLVYPNFIGGRPGDRIDFYNYDATGKGWYVYGQGTVTADGRQIMPDSGVVLYEFSGAMVAGGGLAPGTGTVPGAGAKDGDPVDLGTGLFVYEKTDLLLPDTLPISLTRTYRQNDSRTRPFGIGATHPYEMILVGDTSPYTYMDLILPDGGRVHYDRVSPGTGFTSAVYEHTSSPTAFYGSKIAWNGDGWDLTLRDGTTLVFPEAFGVTSIRHAALVGWRDRYGNALTLTRDSVGNLIRIMSPNGRRVELTYDAGYRITQAKDNIGRTVGYTYDASGRLWKVTDAAGGVTEYTYDASHRILTIKDPRGIVYLTNQYDAAGRVSRQTQADATTYQFAYTLDSGGKVTRTEVTDTRGNVRRVTFNASGYPLTDTYALGKPEQQTVTYERQAGTNKLLSVTDPSGLKTAYAYDSGGNVTDVTRLAGTASAATTHLTYDSRFSQVASVTDPLSHTSTFVYDDKGNLTSITDPLSHQRTFTYNAAGQPLTATDPLQHTTQFIYDSGDLVEVRDALGHGVRRFIDGAGRLISVTDPLGRRTRYEYDALNQIKKVTDALAGTTSFDYDPNGNLLSVTDARGKVTSYTYDQMDRVETRTDPLQGVSSVVTYEYDAAGSLKKLIDRRGKVTTYDYDNLDRMKFAGFGTTVSGGLTSYESTITYTLDANGRITQAADSAGGTITRSYDDLARAWSETPPQGAVGYSYDAAGRLTGKTVTGQADISYAYDDADRLTGITQGASAVGFGYDDAGRRTSLTLPNGVVTDYGYDAASQLTSLTYRFGGVALGDLTYGYDAAGRRARVGGSFARTLLPPALSSSTYDDANRLVQRGASALSYDAAGNLTSDGVNNYTWDARGQLASISGGVTASFQYDAFGRRIGKTVNGQGTSYLYDGMNVAQEQAGGVATANLLAGGIVEVFSRTSDAGAHSFLADGLGSTLALTDGAGATQASYTYAPFGAASVGGADGGNPAQYTGRENDQTGLYYYRARYYSPTLQRFISEDPIGFASGDTNVYAYVMNNPIGKIDPFGLDDADMAWEAQFNPPSPRSDPWYWAHNESADNESFEPLSGRGGYPPQQVKPDICGSGWTGPIVPDKVGPVPVSQPCQAHDDCYGTCGVSKALCDARLRRDIFNVCNSMPKDCILCYPVCAVAPNDYFLGVTLFGGPAYRNAQAKCKP